MIVTEKAMRPASSAKECFYCKAPIGAEHSPDCVLIKKKVKVRMKVDYDIEVPAHWDSATIERHRNRGSWCASNALQELEDLYDTADGPCLCGIATFQYLDTVSEPYLDEA